jgi:V/A-type H+-transporting ATPase subunit D
MPKLSVAPTRSNLLKTKESLQLAEEGYELLDQKREVLLMELMQIVHQLRELESQVVEKSAAAFTALESALLSMGEEAVQWAALSVLKEKGISLLHRSVMGVPVVNMQLQKDPLGGFQASLEGIGPAMDEARRKFEELAEIISRWSEVEISVRRLAAEIRKTQRRVNALDNIFIPGYKHTIKAIDEVLEENDREEFIRKKKVKSVLKKKRR